jgi:hypothetical protein
VLLVALGVVLSIVTGMPWNHTFATYKWPGPFGWVSRNTPGNVVAGFIQVCLGVIAGAVAQKLGVFARVKSWLFRELHEERRRAGEHDKWVAEVLADLHRSSTNAPPPRHPEHGQL